jgi:hypothetical protein
MNYRGVQAATKALVLKPPAPAAWWPVVSIHTGDGRPSPPMPPTRQSSDVQAETRLPAAIGAWQAAPVSHPEIALDHRLFRDAILFSHPSCNAPGALVPVTFFFVRRACAEFQTSPVTSPIALSLIPLLLGSTPMAP